VLVTRTVNDRVLLVDPEPADDGNVMITNHAGGRLAVVFGRADAADRRQAGARLHRPHVATCPQAERARVRRARPARPARPAPRRASLAGADQPALGLEWLRPGR
jgi:hypothetical protein